MWNSVCQSAMELLHKGDVVHIIGRLKNKKVECKDGSKRLFTEINVSEWTRVGSGDNYEDPAIKEDIQIEEVKVNEEEQVDPPF